MHNVCIEHCHGLGRLREFRGLQEVRVINLAPIMASHETILSRDQAVRRMIEAELGSARNSFLTPRLGNFELCLEFRAPTKSGRS